ncbi:MAG: DNA alkylation repair protein [Candidatus Zixiibacteriota bacterium]
MHPIITDIYRTVAELDIPKNQINAQQFFKEQLENPIHIKTAILRKVSNQYFRQVRKLSNKEIYSLCEEFISTDKRYRLFFAFDWAEKLAGKYDKKDFALFKRWLFDLVSNWGECDHLAYGILGKFLLQFPDEITKTKSWTKSKNRWVKRAAAVCLIKPVHQGLFIDNVFQVAEELLTDEDDLVQKGYGWMLKEASERYQREVFDYLMSRKDTMPRTAFRYALEKMPPDLRKQAMKK